VPEDLSLSAPEGLDEPAGARRASPEFAELRELLLGWETQEIEDLRRRIDEIGLTPEQLSEYLPEAIAMSAAGDDKLARALAPTLEGAIAESVQRNPRRIADAIYPILGPAIRKAIADTMAGIVNTINRAIEHSLSWQGLKWRVEAWRTGVPYAQVVIKHGLVYRVEQAFLIHDETGLLLAHVTVPDLQQQDPDLVSGMLTAIRDIARDSLDAGADAGLRKSLIGECTVLVEAGPHARLAAVVRGQPPDDLTDRLQGILELIHLQYGRALQQFEGDASAFEPTKPLLEGCLETVVATDRPRRLGWAPRVAWAVLALAIVVLLVLMVRGSRRWHRAVALVENEPGIVLVEANHSFRSWRFSGLRDPLARDPMALLDSAGLTPRRLNQQWEPYLSFDPELVAARARHMLGAPASVTLAFEGGVLEGHGSAPASWIGRVSRSPSVVPGVADVDLSAVTPEFSPELVDLVRGIEARRVRFAAGSSALDGTASASIAAVSREYLALQTLAGDLDYVAVLKLIGRTDSTGSNETNQALSQLRAESVARALTATGVPSASLEPTGIGTTHPVPAGSVVDAATENRSVSFAVRLQPAAGRQGDQE
jgi:outer membrane protein OmpA-like peptidoglycan-associated protein